MKNRIAFIGHSYHLKTRSSDFFIDLLSKYYDVEYIADDTWRNESCPNLKKIDGNYHAVIFWQMISRYYLKNLKCKNIIFVPMYDKSGNEPRSYWYHFKDLKIINFSETLGQFLENQGFNSLNIRYFPKPIQNQKPGDSKACFFWQRTNEIDWHTVKILLSKSSIDRIHIHTAVDPGFTFISPSRKDERTFHITYSSWFKTKDEYLDIVDKCEFYIAPRYHEGIGLSFLEAMARGKVIIAANRPTMNEYMSNDVNGYLFDPENIKPINFHDADIVKVNSLRTIAEGYVKWLNDQDRIIDFIEASNKKNYYFIKHPFAKYETRSILRTIKTLIKYILPLGIIRLMSYLKKDKKWKKIIKESIKLFIPYGILVIIRYFKIKKKNEASV